MADDDITSIQLKVGTWKELGALKESPRDSYDDVIQRLIKEHKED